MKVTVDLLSGFKMSFDFLVDNTLYGCGTARGDNTHLPKRLDIVHQSPNIAIDFLDPPQDRVCVHYQVNKSRVGSYNPMQMS